MWGKKKQTVSNLSHNLYYVTGTSWSSLHFVTILAVQRREAKFAKLGSASANKIISDSGR